MFSLFQTGTDEGVAFAFWGLREVREMLLNLKCSGTGPGLSFRELLRLVGGFENETVQACFFSA